MTLPAAESQPAPGPIAEPRVVHNVEVALGYILRLGVIISISLVVLGIVVSFVHHSDYLHTSYPVQKPANQPNAKTISEVGDPFPHTLHDTLAALSDFRGQGFIVLGLLALLATPVISVAVAIIAFALQKDRAFTLIASVVLLILCISFCLGRGEGVAPPASGAPPQPAAPQK